MDHQTEILGSPPASVPKQGLGRPFSSAIGARTGPADPPSGRARWRLALRRATLLASIGLAACGQKGPLYLPAPAGVPAQLATASAPSPAAAQPRPAR